jgi:hypothetical protein
MIGRPSALLVTLALCASACSGSSPTAPSAARTGTLTIRLDAACAGVRVVSADLFVDGVGVGPVASGGAYTASVALGQHNVEAAAYNLTTGVRLYHWGPETVTVGTGGFNELFYCA